MKAPYIIKTPRSTIKFQRSKIKLQRSKIILSGVRLAQSPGHGTEVERDPILPQDEGTFCVASRVSSKIKDQRLELQHIHPYFFLF